MWRTIKPQIQTSVGILIETKLVISDFYLVQCKDGFDRCLSH